MAVRGVTDKIRVPRLGVIKIGELVQVPGKPDGVTMPKASDHFILPPEVASVMGNQVTVLEPVMLPFSDRKLFADDEYRLYSQTRGLICRGDGEKATRTVSREDFEKQRSKGHYDAISSDEFEPAHRDVVETARIERSCPCKFLEQSVCSLKMAFQFLLPTVPGFGIWQLNTASRNTILNIASFIEMLNGTFGRAHLIPLRLLLEYTEVNTPDGKRRKVPVCRLDFPSGKTLMNMLDEFRDLPTAAKDVTSQLIANAPPEWLELDDGTLETPYDIAPTPSQKAEATAYERLMEKAETLEAPDFDQYASND